MLQTIASQPVPHLDSDGAENAVQKHDLRVFADCSILAGKNGSKVIQSQTASRASVSTLHLQSQHTVAVVVLQTAVNAHPVPHRQFTVKMLIHDLKHISQLFYQQILGERVQHMCMR